MVGWNVKFLRPLADELPVWWLWVVGGLGIWSVSAAGIAVVVGRGIRLADRELLDSIDLLPTEGLSVVPARRPAGARVRRRAVPLPLVAVVLAAAAVGLTTTGFVVRLTGATGTPARLFASDHGLSLPRMVITLIFAGAALVAIAGAARSHGRRAWWLAVAAVAGGIAVVEAGGPVRLPATTGTEMAQATGIAGALLMRVLLAAAVIGALWLFSRHERRDRRRVLGSLTGYAVASVGLSALSAAVPVSLAATATFIEESVEALAGVSLLVAVLVGVAPRFVLPADWALRRAADDDAVEAARPAWLATGGAAH